MRRTVLSILATFIFTLASTSAFAVEEETAEPRVPLTLEYKVGGQTKVDKLSADPAQVLVALQKKGVTTFGKLVNADPAALGASLSSKVTGLNASAGAPLASVLIASASRSIDDRKAGKVIEISNIGGGVTADQMRSIGSNFGFIKTPLTTGHVSVLLNPSRTYRAVLPK